MSNADIKSTLLVIKYSSENDKIIGGTNFDQHNSMTRQLQLSKYIEAVQSPFSNRVRIAKLTQKGLDFLNA